MKKVFFLLAAAVILSSCDYLMEIRQSDTTLNFKLIEVRGNHVQVKVIPDNDNTMYVADVIEVAEYQEMMKTMTELEFQKMYLGMLKDNYQMWKDNWIGNMDKYVASEFQHEYFVSPVQGYFMNLEPLTRYYVIGFCVDTSTSEPLGPVQMLEFTTPEYQQHKGVEYDFMIRDSKDYFTFYVRPSHEGRICFDTYFCTVFNDSEYKNEKYKNDIRAYLKDWLAFVGGSVELFLSADITRFRTILEEGEEYTIIASPYLNLGEGPLTLLHFKYKKGMSTRYTHDEVIE